MRARNRPPLGEGVAAEWACASIGRSFRVLSIHETAARVGKVGLTDALQSVPIGLGQLLPVRVEPNVSRLQRQFHDLSEPLPRCSNTGRPDLIFSLVARRSVRVSPMRTSALLVLDSHAVDLAPGPLAEIADLPSLDVSRDINPLDLGDQCAVPASGPLIQVVGDVHLARPALVLRLGGAVRPLLSRAHDASPHWSS